MPQRQKYRYVKHTADVEFLAYGKDMRSVFKNAMLALFDTIAYIEKIAGDKASRTKRFSIRDNAATPDALLWYALQDALSVADSKGLFAYRADDISIVKRRGGYSFSAKVYGKPQKAEHSKLDVKGVSGYDLKIRKLKGGYSASVVVDV